MANNLRYKLFSSTLIPIVLRFVKEFHGIGNIPKNESFVVVSNHESYIDPLIINALFDKYVGKIVFYLAKKELYNGFFKKFFFESVGTIPLDRGKNGEKALSSAIDKLKNGNIIGIFPEGTRSLDGKMQKGKTGCVRIALAAKCRLLPIGINNTFEIWPPQRKLPKLARAAVINIGTPISLKRHYDKKITKALLRGITDTIMKEIARMSGQEYG